MRRQEEVTLALRSKGRREVTRDLKAIGGSHEKVAREIQAANVKSSRGLLAVSAASKSAQAGVAGLAASSGGLGGVLGAMGPAGLAAAAGIGALALGLKQALDIGREAVSAFDAIGKSADTLNLSTDAFQALQSEAQNQGVEFAKIEGAVRRLDKGVTELATSQGDLFNKLKDTNPELLEQLKLTSNNDQRLQLLISALQGAETGLERANIAYAAFGKSGADVARLLVRQTDGLNGTIKAARELGLVVDEELIRSSEDLENSFGLASQVIDLQLKQAFVGLAPVMLEAAENTAVLVTGFADLLQSFRNIDEQTTDSLERRLKRLADPGLIDQALNAVSPGRQIRQLQQAGAAAEELAERDAQARREKANEDRLRQTDEALKAERDALVAHLEAAADLAAGADIALDVNFDLASALEDQDSVRQVIAQIEGELSRRAEQASFIESGDKLGLADKKRAEAAEQRRLDGLRRESKTILRELGDQTVFLADQEARLNEIVAAGFLTRDQANDRLARMKADLDGTSDALARWQGLLEAARSPVELVQVELDALSEDFKEGRIGIDLYNQAFADLQGKLTEARETERAGAPGAADAERVRMELQSIADNARTPAQRLADETQRINDLVANNQLDADDASRWLTVYGERLEEAGEQSALFREAEGLLTDAINGRIKSFEDLGNAFKDILTRMITDYFTAQNQLGGTGGGFLGGLFGGGGGAGAGGGGAAGAGVAAGGAGGSGGGLFSGLFGGGGGEGGGGLSAGLGGLLGGVIGGGIGAFAQSRGNRELRRIRRNTARIVELIEQGAQPRIDPLRGMLDAVQQNNTAFTGELRVVINDFVGADISQERVTGPEGPELRIDFKRRIQEFVGGGGIDEQMRNRFGLLPSG